MSNLTRTEAIKELSEMRTDPWTDSRQMQALDIAINSLKIDEQYDLMYEQAEPKTGHWIVSNVPNSIFQMCSECGFNRAELYFNFCPNCGADMRGEE